METQYTTSSTLLRYFRSIEPGAYLRIIDFFESYEGEIMALDAVECITILSYYVDALYEVGDYENEVIYYAGIILEKSIIDYIQYVDGQDIYMRSLLQSAVSYLQLGKFDKGFHLAKQLYKLAPNDKTCSKLIRDCLLVSKPKWIMQCFKASVAFIFSALIIKVLGFVFALGTVESILIMTVFALSSFCSLACLYGHYKYIVKPMKTLKQ